MPPDASTTDITAPRPVDILRAMDAAIEEHGNWLTRWHRALVCGLPPDKDIIAENSADLTEFGHWHDQHRQDPLLAQMAFQELWQDYTALHDSARSVARRATTRPVSAQDYDGVMAKSDAFLNRARRIRDAFRKAVSDLDPLTGLSNRTTMNAELAAEYERAVRTDTPCCIALADIDHFKKVNDTYGHGVGDQVLAATANRFLSQLRPYDLIYRYGGEEFLLCLPNTDPKTAKLVLERLRIALFERPIPLEGDTNLSVSASFGFAQIQESVPLKDIIAQADQALYQAKQAGRNRVIGLEKDMTNGA